MILEQEIRNRYSKEQVLKTAAWIGRDPRRLRELIRLLDAAEERVALRAAWLVSICAEQRPATILPWLSRLITLASKSDAPEAVKRNVVRTLQFVRIPRRLQGKCTALCFSFLQNPKEAIAVRAFSMTVLAAIAEEEPDLRNEIVLTIQQILPYASSGIKARARRELARLSK